MTEEVTRIVPEPILDCMYVTMLDAYERVGPVGVHDLRRCLNYLETEHKYEPPKKSNAN